MRSLIILLPLLFLSCATFENLILGKPQTIEYTFNPPRAEIPSIYDIRSKDFGINTFPIHSNQDFFENRDREITNEIRKLLSSGTYNVTQVHLGFTDGYLTSASISYDTRGPGQGNMFRLRFIREGSDSFESTQERPKEREKRIFCAIRRAREDIEKNQGYKLLDIKELWIETVGRKEIVGAVIGFMVPPFRTSEI